MMRTVKSSASARKAERRRKCVMKNTVKYTLDSDKVGFPILCTQPTTLVRHRHMISLTSGILTTKVQQLKRGRMPFKAAVLLICACVFFFGGAQPASAGGQCRNERSGPDCPCDKAKFVRNAQGKCVPPKSTHGKRKPTPSPDPLKQCMDNAQRDYEKNIKETCKKENAPYAATCEEHYSEVRETEKTYCKNTYGSTTPRSTRPSSSPSASPSTSPSASQTPRPSDQGTCLFPGTLPTPATYEQCVAKCGGGDLGDCKFEKSK